jgi:hypothetical protein
MRRTVDFAVRVLHAAAIVKMFVVTACRQAHAGVPGTQCKTSQTGSMEQTGAGLAIAALRPCRVGFRDGPHAV